MKLLSGLDCHTKNFKGHNPAKNVCGVTVLVLCTSFDDSLDLYQVASSYQNIFNGFEVTERTRYFIPNVPKGFHSAKIEVELRLLFSAYRLMVVYTCTKLCENILNGIRVMERTQMMGR